MPKKSRRDRSQSSRRESRSRSRGTRSRRRELRSRSRESRSRRRELRSRSRVSRSRNRDSHSRDRRSDSSLRYKCSRSTRQRRSSPNTVTNVQMRQILDKLTTLEERCHPPSPRPRAEASSVTERRESTSLSSARRSVSTPTDRDGNATDRIIDAIRSINTTVRSNQSYYISNFDPCINDIETWCEEVDRAKVLNNWNDNECLSRIGNCFKGDARMWLNEWVTNDRSWSNFKREFKPLCPKKPNIANILYEVMSTSSDKYPTYADYARRSLLKLRIVKGLSDQLISAIVIRGVTDPQIRASATNAKLTPNELVEFFSIYVKSNTLNVDKKSSHSLSNTHFPKHEHNIHFRKRRFENGCFLCGQPGHKQSNCTKRAKPTPSTSNNDESSQKKMTFYMVQIKLNNVVFVRSPVIG